MRSTDSPAPAGVKAFNALGDETAAARLAACLRAPGWVASVLSGRPYPDQAAVLSTAHQAAVRMDDEDLDHALGAHPRIGERPAGTGPEAAHSRAEQGGVDPKDDDLAARLRVGNLAYEERFGHVFLIRAAGRSGPEVLAALSERLTNSPAREAAVVREELAQIAQLRLAALLSDLGDGGEGR